MNRSSLSVGAVLCLSAATAIAQPPSLSLDDFVPPVAGGASEPTVALTTAGTHLSAPDAQNGLAHAYQQLMAGGRNGVEEVAVPSGYAVLSLSTEDYRTYENLNATLLSKRSAYARAYARAQKQLVANFEGIKSVCTASTSATLESRDGGSGENLSVSATSIADQCRDSAEGALAGYVLYSVKDNAPAEKTVTVAIASSSKTRNAAQRAGGAVIVADDNRGAWDALMTEITANVVPPFGARIIFNPRTDETTVVGFGSAIVRQNPDAAMARRLSETAERQAQMRANRALIAFLQGDKVYWEGSFDERQVETAEQFEYVPPEVAAPKTTLVERLSQRLGSMMGEAQASGSASAEIRPLDKTRSGFLNVLKQSDDIRKVTQGELPPGIKSRSFVDKDGHWAIAISVYAPSLTARAVEAGRENRQAGAAPASAGPAVPADRPVSGGLSEGALNPQGPTGQVTGKDDL